MAKYIDRELLLEIDTCCAKSDLSPTAFGVRAAGDPRLIPDLKEGRELRRKTRAKILSFIAKQSSDHSRGDAA